MTTTEYFRVDRTWPESVTIDRLSEPSVVRTWTRNVDPEGKVDDHFSVTVRVPSMSLDSLEMLHALINDLQQLEQHFIPNMPPAAADTQDVEPCS
jgi:hypothetical protein